MATGRLDELKPYIRALAEAEPRDLLPFEQLPGGMSPADLFGIRRAEREEVLEGKQPELSEADRAAAQSRMAGMPKPEVLWNIFEVSVEDLSSEERSLFATIAFNLVNAALYKQGHSAVADNLLDYIDMPHTVEAEGKFRLAFLGLGEEEWQGLDLVREYEKILLLAKALPWNAETVRDIDMVSGEETERSVLTLRQDERATDVLESFIVHALSEEEELPIYHRTPDGRIFTLEGNNFEGLLNKAQELATLVEEFKGTGSEEVKDMLRRAVGEETELLDELRTPDLLKERMEKAAPRHYVVTDDADFRARYKEATGADLPRRGIRPDGV